MCKVYLMLHDDWEIYGDGTGNPEKLMFEPAKKILDICDKYGAKYTFFAEIGQQLNMLNSSSKKWNNYARTWEDIMKDAISRGHDVQLHFHPQWANAKLINDEWHLDFNNWHSGSVVAELLEKWIKFGKEYLENLLKPLNTEYDLVAYRAGGWMCQPSNGLYYALNKNNILCDVSVMKGRYIKYEDGSFVDFRHAVSRFHPWQVDPNDFAKQQDNSNIWELPVFTEVSKLPSLIYLLKKGFDPIHYLKIYIKNRKKKNNYSPKIIERAKSKEYYGSFGYMHYKHLLKYVNQISKRNDKVLFNHLIFLTHSKSFYSYNNFDQLLLKLGNCKNVCFTTTRKYIKNRFVNLENNIINEEKISCNLSPK